VTFTLNVDAVSWRDNLNRAIGDRRVAVGWPEGGDVIAVVKGNGYGFTPEVLAREAARAGATSVAIGTIFEVARVLADFAGDVFVLEPFDPRDEGTRAAWSAVAASPDAGRVIRTIASLDGASAVAHTDGRIVVEMLTSVRRFGLTVSEFPSLLRTLEGGPQIEGLAVHLPMTTPSDGDAVSEVVQAAALWHTALVDAGRDLDDSALRILVSHVEIPELRALRAALPDISIHPRVGTALWLGAPESLRVTGTVLAVHDPTERGVGYRQRRGPRGARLVVISGGTSHGVALAAPSSNVTLRQRAIAASTGLLDAAGRTTSPFTVAGELRMFAEPPHMHVSLVWLPSDVPAPQVGDEVEVRVRNTTATFDRVVGLDY